MCENFDGEDGLFVVHGLFQFQRKEVHEVGGFEVVDHLGFGCT